MRYLVFAHHTYYPEGGMNDCVLKTDDVDLAIKQLHKSIDEGYWAHAYDTETDELMGVEP